MIRTGNWLKGVAAFLGMAAFVLALPHVHAIKKRPSLEASDHPEVVLVTARTSKGTEIGKSSGALIAPNAVLTAAHGMSKFDAWEVTAPYAKNGPLRARSRTPKVHPDFKPGVTEHDLAVLVLDGNIDIGAKYPALHDGDLYPIDTKLVILGRVRNGTLSNTQLFKAPVALVQFPGNTHLYGGLPHVVEEGDSGGPVFVTGKDAEIAALVSGHVGLTRSTVHTDCFIPINRRNRAWILRQIPKMEK
jgi:hypothetical protein